MATGFGVALAQSSERTAHVNERIAVSRMIAAAHARAEANWFHWIAGLSLINSIVVIAGVKFHLGIGLGITSVVDAMARRAGSLGAVLDIVVNAFVAAVFVLFGRFAGRAKKWAFLLGMTVYGLDAVLLLGAKDFLGIAFHAYALYAIYGGYTAAKRIQV